MKSYYDEAKRAGDTEQASSLRDGIVSREEYEAAWSAEVVCIRAAGLDVSDLTLDPLTGILLSYSVETGFDNRTEGASAADFDKSVAIGQQCGERYRKWVDLGYQAQETVTRDLASAYQAAAAAIEACGAEHGIPLKVKPRLYVQLHLDMPPEIYQLCDGKYVESRSKDTSQG